MNVQKTLLTIKETARYFNVPEFAVRGFCKRGKFPVFMSGTRTYISREVFQQFLEKGGEVHNAVKQSTSK